MVFFSTALLVLARAERIYTEYKQYTIKKMRIIQQIEKENPYEKKNRETASYYDNQFDYSQFGDFNSMDFPMR